MFGIMRSNALQRSLKAKDPILNVTIHELSTELSHLIFLLSLSLYFLSDSTSITVNIFFSFLLPQRVF